MDQQSWLTERFEENRTQLRRVAYRMLGSFSKAEDAVQGARVRLNRIGHAHTRGKRIKRVRLARLIDSRRR